jgi:ribonuclease T2
MGRKLRWLAAAALGVMATAGHARDFAFAVSWQPAFCESKASKRECMTETAARFDATHFSLHGLWPQDGEYCGITAQDKQLDDANHWAQLPPVKLSPATAERLAQRMPGVVSYLDRHEWTRHGSCSRTDPDTYFTAAMNLLDAVNASRLQAVVSGNLGKSVPLDALVSAVVEDFGEPARTGTEFMCSDLDGKRALLAVQFALRTADGLPAGMNAQTLVPPKSPASKQQLCSSGLVYIDAVKRPAQ